MMKNQKKFYKMSDQEKEKIFEEEIQEPDILKEKPSKTLIIFLIVAISLVVIALVVLLFLTYLH